MSPRTQLSIDEAHPAGAASGQAAEVILSFDVEEHHRIEAAAGLAIGPDLVAEHGARVGPAVDWLLDRLGSRGVRATFFLLGTIARDDPAMVRAIAAGGHEVASHGWDHRRILEMTPEQFRLDIRQAKDALEQATGGPILGYRAPTFSIVRRTAWALDVLAEEGFLYDSSIYPVRHDRYGVPGAPRFPFVARGPGGAAILEIPPATLRLPGFNLPVGGGGYFRLLPPALMESAIREVGRRGHPAVAMLYFHPWEFDPGQPRLPLPTPSRLRTYVGISRTRGRFETLLSRHEYARAVDVATRLDADRSDLVAFEIAGG